MRFFAAVPPETSAAFVVVQHLSPNHKSMMDELLSRRTSLKVAVVENATRVEPGHIYLLRPGWELEYRAGELHSVPVDQDEAIHLPVDRILTSLAAADGQVFGVILSGTGSDGSRGVQTLVEAGGMALAESDESAKFTGMPHAAEATGVVTVRTAAELLWSKIAGELGEQVASPVAPAKRAAGLDALLQRLDSAYSIDFQHYKRGTVERRIERRMQIAGVTDRDAYADAALKDDAELERLYADLLIGVTRFFRDKECFETLSEEVLAPMVNGRSADRPIRIWAAACATGEEAYSIAILLREQMEAHDVEIPTQIFATDVHRDSLTFASSGRFPEDRLGEVSRTRLKKYFDRVDGEYRVRDQLRRMIVFAPHNVLRDAPFTNLDLVSCRNMLIYLTPEAQRRVLSLFHFALNDAGHLFLGPSESLGETATAFDTVNERCRVYEKSSHRRIMRPTHSPPAANLRPRGATTSTAPHNASTRIDTRLLAAYDNIIDRYAPPAILVNDKHEVIDTFAGADQYLRLSARRPTQQLAELLETPWHASLLGGLRRAQQIEARVTFNGFTIDHPHAADKIFTVAIDPILGTDEPYFLISLNAERDTHSRGVETGESQPVPSGDLSQLEQVEDELRYTRETLQATIEELETSNEELRVTNEEMTASNEELQATNEELNSVNEEMHTVNTEYQNTIGELRELNEDMNHLLASTDIGTLFLDAELRIRRYTPHIEKIVSLTPQDIGRPLADFAHKLDCGDLSDMALDVMQSEKVMEIEARDEDDVEYLVRISPYLVDGGISGAVVAAVDVSQLSEARREERQSRAELQRQIDAIPTLVGTVDAHLRYERVNAAYAERFGMTQAEIVGSPVSEILGAESFASAGPYLEKALGGKRAQFETHTTDRHGGRKDHVVDYVPRRDDDGNVTGVYVSVSDITVKRQAEERYRAIVEQASDAIIMADAEGRILDANEQANSLLAYAPGELEGLPIEKLIAHADHERLHKITNDSAQRSVRRDEWFLVKGDGSLLPSEMSIRQMSTREWQFIARDITQRKHVEQQLAHAKIAADAANAAKSEFLANMSHEIRTPLSAILGYSEILAKHMEGNDDRDILDKIALNGRHLLDIVNEILDLSKIEAGQLDINRRPVEIREFFANVCKLVEGRASEEGLDLTLKLASDLPRTLVTDPQRLRQILLNLLSNAIKFTDRGFVRVAVKCNLDARSGRELEVSVQDSGDGIPQDQIEHLFEPFQQLDSSSSRSYEGTGLGLAICRRLADVLGGRLSVSSELGEGTTFELSLPLEVVSGRIDLDVAPDDEQEATVEPLDAHVLIVDDRADMRDLLAGYVVSAGGRTTVVGSGAQAMKKISERAQEYDAIIMDMQMPDMDGFHTTRKIREQGFEAPIVAVTAGAMRQDREKSLEAGCDAYLAKPVSTALLIATIKDCLRAGANGAPRVMLVEDSEHAREALAELLTARGCAVITAGSAREALAAFDEHRPAIVLVDLGLPDAPGEQLAAALRKRGGDRVALIALSGRELSDQERVQAGFDLAMLKPVDSARLNETIESYLQ